jgi:hypothetical protein
LSHRAAVGHEHGPLQRGPLSRRQREAEAGVHGDHPVLTVEAAPADVLDLPPGVAQVSELAVELAGRILPALEAGYLNERRGVDADSTGVVEHGGQTHEPLHRRSLITSSGHPCSLPRTARSCTHFDHIGRHRVVSGARPTLKNAQRRRGSMSTRFEDAVTASWAQFEGRLGAAIAGLEDDWIEIGVQGRGDPDEEPSVDIGASPTEIYAFLYDFPGRAAEALRALGWEPQVRTEDPIVDWEAKLPRSHQDVLVSMVTGALRSAYGVLDPSFLVSDLSGEEPQAEAEEDPGSEPPVELVEPPISTPASPEELQSLVDQTLSAHLELEVQHDADGDVPITNGIVPVWVQVSPSSPRVRVFSHVVVDVRRKRQALIEMDVLNRRSVGISFYLEEDRIVAESYVSATPFVAQHLVETVDDMLAKLDDLAGDLAERVTGQLFFHDVVPPTGESRG